MEMKEAERLAELTDRIVANLKTIEESDFNSDAELEKTKLIVLNLKRIEENEIDITELFEETNTIVSNLRKMKEAQEAGNKIEVKSPSRGLMAQTIDSNRSGKV